MSTIQGGLIDASEFGCDPKADSTRLILHAKAAPEIHKLLAVEISKANILLLGPCRHAVTGAGGVQLEHRQGDEAAKAGG